MFQIVNKLAVHEIPWMLHCMTIVILSTYLGLGLLELSRLVWICRSRGRAVPPIRVRLGPVKTAFSNDVPRAEDLCKAPQALLSQMFDDKEDYNENYTITSDGSTTCGGVACRKTLDFQPPPKAQPTKGCRGDSSPTPGSPGQPSWKHHILMGTGKPSIHYDLLCGSRQQWGWISSDAIVKETKPYLS